MTDISGGPVSGPATKPHRGSLLTQDALTKRRNAAEARFKAYGIVAITLSVLAGVLAGAAYGFIPGLLKAYTGKTPWLLAGGLVRTNVGAAIKASGAKGVDVSSGVETRPGVKSPARIRAFVKAAHAARVKA